MSIRKSILTGLFITCLLVFPLFAAPTTQVEEPVLKPVTWTYKDKSYDIYLQWIDLKDPTIRVELSLASNKIGAVDSLEALSKPSSADKTVLASINGSYFNLKPDSQPVSTLMQAGQIQHIANNGSVVGFDGNNAMHMYRMGFKITGTINDQWEWPYNFMPWNINHYFDRSDAVMLFNSYYTGAFPKTNVYAVAVERNEVIGLYEYIPNIPTYGYIIVTRTPDILKLFKVGDKVDFKVQAFELDDKQQFTTKEIEIDYMRTAIGAGPMMIQNGVKVLNAKAEGFSLSKETALSKRSMIGMDANGRLALVTTPEMNLETLTEFALSIGLVNAMNLDGGQSSGMMMNNQMVSKPGRLISNALVITKLKEQPIRVTLNDKELHFSTDPFITKGRTMVPLRRILEMLGCQVTWEHATQKVLVKRYNSQLSFEVGSASVLADGKVKKMDVPLLLKEGTSFISLRALTEFFGGEVTWSEKERLVGLKLPTVNTYFAQANDYLTSGQISKALSTYQYIILLNPKHLASFKQSAFIYQKYYQDLHSATVYYKRILDVVPDDTQTLYKLGMVYLDMKQNDLARASFDKILSYQADNEYAIHGLAKTYETSNPTASKGMYEWLVKNAKEKQFIDEATRFLNNL